MAILRGSLPTGSAGVHGPETQKKRRAVPAGATPLPAVHGLLIGPSAPNAARAHWALTRRQVGVGTVFLCLLLEDAVSICTAPRVVL